MVFLLSEVFKSFRLCMMAFKESLIFIGEVYHRGMKIFIPFLFFLCEITDLLGEVHVFLIIINEVLRSLRHLTLIFKEVFFSFELLLLKFSQPFGHGLKLSLIKHLVNIISPVFCRGREYIPLLIDVEIKIRNKSVELSDNFCGFLLVRDKSRHRISQFIQSLFKPVSYLILAIEAIYHCLCRICEFIGLVGQALAISSK